MKNSEALIEMLLIFGPLTVDWMGFPITESNPLTFHHIKKKADKGKARVSNGALLGKKSHRILNVLEVHRYEIYQEWNMLFMIINESRRPPNDECRLWIKALKERTLEFMYGGEYKQIKKEAEQLKLRRREDRVSRKNIHSR